MGLNIDRQQAIVRLQRSFFYLLALVSSAVTRHQPCPPVAFALRITENTPLTREHAWPVVCCFLKLSVRFCTPVFGPRVAYFC